jgi:hypothetical protein
MRPCASDPETIDCLKRKAQDAGALLHPKAPLTA